MRNVEADALAGPLLAERARRAGTVYSLAYGDQPALICELVDGARACGFEVMAAGKGTRYLPAYHAVTPDPVWEHYGIVPARAAAAGMNARMFNSFLDGARSAIGMAAVASATGLAPSPDGLAFPTCGVADLASVLAPREFGGMLHHAGTVEVVSSLQRDARPVAGDLRGGVYVTFRVPADYAARRFGEYGLMTDPSGRVSALYRPFHLIGLELGIPVASVALHGEPTGAPAGFCADAVATAKRDLGPGERLDGEGGCTAWVPAADSPASGALPIGLEQDAAVLRPVPAGRPILWSDVAVDETQPAVRLRREMEQRFAPPCAAPAR